MFAPHHQYQRDICERFGGHILNAGCKEDPANLGIDFNAVNMDITDFDPQEQISLYEVTNFVQGDNCDIPFGDSSFDLVVAGEFLEHCPVEAAKLALSEFRRVTTPRGKIALTIPLDGRPPEVQHAPHLLVTWKHGITSWHQTVWTDELLGKVLEDLALEEVLSLRRYLDYGFCKGIGICLEKVN